MPGSMGFPVSLIFQVACLNGFFSGSALRGGVGKKQLRATVRKRYVMARYWQARA